MLLLASVLVGGEARADPGWRGFPLVQRVCFAIVALAVVVGIAIPLGSTSEVRQSQADARDGDLGAALSAARTAQNVQPGAATPRLEQALLLEQAGALKLARSSARAATARESTNWRPWLVLSRIEAEAGDAGAALRDYRRAKSLNPRASLFDGHTGRSGS
jgi:Flp pilus assembly protein TadD